MKQALAILIAATVCAAFPLYAEEDPGPEDYAMQQGGVWPESWPKELDPFRNFPIGQHARSFKRPDEPLIHYGIRFLTKEEFQAAWPHLLKVKGKGAPIILRRGPTFWLGGASHGVCVHSPAKSTKPLSEEDLKKSPWKTTNYLELFVDGEIVDLNRTFLPPDTPIIDKRFQK